jgi:hypothetical protein
MPQLKDYKTKFGSGKRQLAGSVMVVMKYKMWIS